MSDGFPTPCRLGFLEHDNARYCFEHFGFTSSADPSGRCSEAAKVIAASRAKREYAAHLEQPEVTP